MGRPGTANSPRQSRSRPRPGLTAASAMPLAASMGDPPPTATSAIPRVAGAPGAVGGDALRVAAPPAAASAAPATPAAPATAAAPPAPASVGGFVGAPPNTGH